MHTSFAIGARVCEPHSTREDGTLRYVGTVVETRGTMFKDTAVLVDWDGYGRNWEVPQTLGLVRESTTVNFTRQADSTHCVIYGTPEGELLVTYWPSLRAAEGERAEVLELGARNAHIERLSELDRLEGE